MATSNIPTKLIGDDRRVREILMSLVKNAIKFTEQGSVAIECESKQSETDNVAVHIAVRDTGIGFPPDKKETIFQHFTQLESANTRKNEGIGLGLAVCKAFVQLMGGRIWAESTEGQGSVFHLLIPFSNENKARD